MATPSSTLLDLTGDNLIDAATHGYYWQLSSGRTINWALADGFFEEFWTSPSAVVSTLTGVFNNISSYVNVNFNYVGYYTTPSVAYSSGSDITISLGGSGIFGSNTSIWAVGLFPDSFNNTVYYPGAPGDIFLNINSLANSLLSYAPGSTGYALAIHEIGHTLGLKHPFDDGGTGSPTLDSLGLEEANQDWFTVMAYNDDYNYNLRFWDPATPMAMDVLALQYLYGPNLQTNSSNTTYTLPVNNQYQTIWDAGGADVVDISGSSVGWDIVLPDVQFSSLVATKVGGAIPLNESSLSSPLTLYWLMGDIENVLGSAFDEDIEGSSLSNILSGNGGNDFLDGGAGNDTLDGGAGADTMTGGSGTDTFFLASDSIDTITDFVAGFGGEILDVSGLLNNQVSMANGNVRFVQSGADTLFQFDADGSAGNADSFHTIAILKGVTGTNINAHNFNQIVKLGTAGDDVLTGGLGNDTLSGGAGNDILDGDWGGDVMEGGTGDDTYYVDNLDDVIKEFTDQGNADKVVTTIDYTLGGELEDLEIGQGAAHGTKGLGNALNNRLKANDKGSELDGGDGSDDVQGGLGDDNLKGGKGNDHLKGGSGNDRVDAGEGDDEIVGGDGAGDDIYIGGSGIDTVIYTSAISTITVNLANGTASGVDIDNDTLSGIENIVGGQAGDILIGDANANVIDGFTGDDILDGGLGNDTLLGGAGNDTYLINTLRDRVVETLENGIDSIQANIAVFNKVSFFGKKIPSQFARGPSIETPDNVENLSLLGFTRAHLIGNGLDNALTGNGADNVLNGMDGNDTLIGGWGRDTLLGGLGDDIMDGGGGQDRLIGGAGNDIFVFSATSDSSAFSAFSLPDVITDFEPGFDQIDLSAIDAVLGGVNDAFLWGGNTVATVAHSVTWFDDGPNTIIRIDNTGDAVADMQIVLTGTGLGLLATDFIL